MQKPSEKKVNRYEAGEPSAWSQVSLLTAYLAPCQNEHTKAAANSLQMHQEKEFLVKKTQIYNLMKKCPSAS